MRSLEHVDMCRRQEGWLEGKPSGHAESGGERERERVPRRW